MSKLTFEDFIALFMRPRKDHPGRKSGQRYKGNIGRQVSGNSKWNRRTRNDKSV